MATAKTNELKAYKRVAGKLDIRRFLLADNDPHAELIGKLVRAYKVDPRSILVYWKDSEGDFVAIEDEDDIRCAVAATNGALLKVFVVDTDGKSVSEEFAELTLNEKPSCPTATRGGVHHPYVTCDGCQSAIFGRRFKCVECADYDLCERCELDLNRHPEHNMVLIRRPSPSGCPFVFNGRNRVHGVPPVLPGCPIFRGPRCGRFRCPQPKAESDQTTTESEQKPEMNPLEMSFGDLVRQVQNGELSTVLGAVNEVLRPLGADLSVFLDPAERRDSATTTATSGNVSADSSEQAGSSGRSTEQSSEAKPTTNSTSVETARVETTDKPSQSAEAQAGTPKATGPYAAELQALSDMGFVDDPSWMQRLLVEKRGNMAQVIDILTGKAQL